MGGFGPVEGRAFSSPGTPEDVEMAPACPSLLQMSGRQEDTRRAGRIEALSDEHLPAKRPSYQPGVWRTPTGQAGGSHSRLMSRRCEASSGRLERAPVGDNQC